MANIKLPKYKRKDKEIILYVTPGVFAIISKRARQAKTSKSKFLRKLVLDSLSGLVE